MTAAPAPAPLRASTPSSSAAIPPRARTRSRLARVVAVAGLGAVAAGGLVAHAAGPAAADLAPGVQYVHFDPAPYICAGEVPCLPDAGVGKSNTIYVHQREVDGELRYDEVTGTSTDPDTMWLQTTFEAKCASRFRLNKASIDFGGQTGVGGGAGDFGGLGDGSEPRWVLPINTANQTIPVRNIALHPSVDELLEDGLFVDRATVLAWGEARVAERIADGESELDARRVADDTTLHATMSATVHCRQTSGLYAWIGDGNVESRTDASGQPVQVVFLGEGMEPGDEDDPNFRQDHLPTPPVDRPDGGDLSIGFDVDQVHLSAIADPELPCRVHLSGVVTASGPGEISYRFRDQLGAPSQIFHATIDQTRSVLLDHHIDVTPAAAPTGPSGGGLGGQAGWFAPIEEPGDGGIGGYIAETADHPQGLYTLEVLGHADATSDPASFDLPGCTAPGEGPTVGGTVVTPASPLAQPLAGLGQPPVGRATVGRFRVGRAS